MMRRSAILFFALFPFFTISAQEGRGDILQSDIFPIALFFEAAEYAAEGCWRPDWPLDFPPDAFSLGSGDAVSITVTSGNNSYMYKQNLRGIVTEFPYMYEGMLVQVLLEFEEDDDEQGARFKAAYLVDAGGRGYLASIEVLEYRGGYPYLLRIHRNGVYSFVIMNRVSNGITEAWFDENGGFSGGFVHRLLPLSYAPFGSSPKTRIEISSSIQDGDNDSVLFSFDSRSLITSVRSREGDFFIQYYKENLPRYWERRPAEISIIDSQTLAESPPESDATNGSGLFAEKSGRYNLQWDEKNFLLRLYSLEGGNGDFFDRRYEYDLDEKGNWIARREIIMSRQFGYLASNMGPPLTRILEYKNSFTGAADE